MLKVFCPKDNMDLAQKLNVSSQFSIKRTP